MRIVRSLLAAVIVTASAGALADTTSAGGSASVQVVRSQFTDKVEHSDPVDGPDQLAQAPQVTYWLAVKNDKAPTTVTLVWKLDGKESGRQSLDVGTSPAWKTWGTHARSGAKSIEVDVLDANGGTIKTDTL
jgi:hypothetical protein